MAETHPLRSPSQRPTDPTFAEWNLQAEDLAKQCRPAEVPSLDHLRMTDYDCVYEPSDDTFLLLDGLGVDFNGGDCNKDCRDGNDPAESIRITLEIGCGTGVVTTYLAKTLRDRRRKFLASPSAIMHYATDVNGDAVRTTVRTAHASGLPPLAIEAINCDLATPLISRFSGQVDVLIFNPPYVPTPNDEVGSSGIEASWAGGTNGRVVLDRALPQIANLLRWPSGAAYIITVDDNMPENIADIMMREYGVKVKPLVRRRARNEYLTVQKMTLTRKLDST